MRHWHTQHGIHLYIKMVKMLAILVKCSRRNATFFLCSFLFNVRIWKYISEFIHFATIIIQIIYSFPHSLTQTHRHNPDSVAYRKFLTGLFSPKLITTKRVTSVQHKPCYTTFQNAMRKFSYGILCAEKHLFYMAGCEKDSVLVHIFSRIQCVCGRKCLLKLRSEQI